MQVDINPIENIKCTIENIKCKVCELGNKEEILLLCDACDQAFHTTCIGLTQVPKEDVWRCPRCVMFAVAVKQQEQKIRDLFAVGSKVIVYLRISSQGQDDVARGRVGLQTQNHAILQFVLLNNYQIVQTYVDVGSGRNLEQRTKFKEMLKQLPENVCVLIYSVSRFARNVEDVRYALDCIHSKGCVVVSVVDQCTSNDQRFFELSQQAQNESNNLSNVVRQSLERRRQMGSHIGPAPYGQEVYRSEDGRRLLRQNEREQHILQFIKHNKNYTRIATILNDKGDLYRGGKEWTKDIVSRVSRSSV